MKTNGKITFLINRENTTIEIKDESSGITFLKVELTPDQLSSALSRLAHTDCKIEVFDLINVGKTLEIDEFVVEIPKYIQRHDIEQIKEYVQNQIDILLFNQGWVSSGYFGAKNSFFYKDEVLYVRDRIKRWV